jgi:phosphohistidine phosphatase
MKTLLLIRHAKSSWANPQQSDFERSLNDRGLHDAPLMAQRLQKQQLRPDLFISSTAVRARQTTNLLVQEWDKNQQPHIIYAENLYLAPPEVIEATLREVDNKYNCVALVAHNPGITDFVNQLTHVRTDNMPTCAVYAVRVHTNNWKNLATAKKEFLLFDYPKKK